MEGFSKVPKPTAGHRVEKRAIATQGFITRHPARLYLLAIHDLANDLRAQAGLGAKPQIARHPTKSALRVRHKDDDADSNVLIAHVLSWTWRSKYATHSDVFYV